MRWATHLGLFTLAVLLPVHAGAQGGGTFAESNNAGPVERILCTLMGHSGRLWFVANFTYLLSFP